ncbi:Acetyltransferase [Grimontia indica]|uniref:Acetyltransferase n=1 Tax=Grimontia indica TaxID=1056512 RepID=R1GZ33_9GAMM|nr:Acetyltransferase [Grimontia indica]
MFEVFELFTPRLKLRDFLKEDLPDYFSMTQDGKYQRFYSPDDVSAEKAEYLVALFQEQAISIPRTHYQLAVCDKETGQFMGTVGLRLEQPGKASVGCGLSREFHHSGLAEEAMTALVAYGVESLDIQQLYAETIAENKAAIRLCQKMGMTEIERRAGDVTFAGRQWDTLVMSRYLK